MSNIIALVYLADVVNAVFGVAVALAAIFGIVAAVFTILGYAYEYCYDEEKQKAQRIEFAATGKKFWKFMIVPLLIAMFIPSKQICYIAAGAKTAEYITTETKVGKALNDNTVKIINDVSTIIHNYAHPEGEKKQQ